MSALRVWTEREYNRASAIGYGSGALLLAHDRGWLFAIAMGLAGAALNFALLELLDKLLARGTYAKGAP